MSLHHVRLIHGSEPNPSPRRRIGFAIRCLPTHVRQTVGDRDFATLVHGVDTYHNFEVEQRPETDMSDAARAFHARVTGAQTQVLMRDTGRTMDVKYILSDDVDARRVLPDDVTAKTATRDVKTMKLFGTVPRPIIACPIAV
jgi:hypothetical protein